MQREILFRWKQINTGEWFFGNLFDKDINGRTHITTTNRGCLNIDTETVGQFTGLTDKNGTKIFEGDVLKFVGGTCDFFVKSAYGHRHEKGTIFTVKWFPSGYTLYESKTKNPSCPNCWSNIGNYDFWNNSRSFEVIGNIHDNKDLLK